MRNPTMSEDDVEQLVDEKAGVGTWVREVYDGTDEWHRSIEYDGEIHYLGCGYAIAAQTRVGDVDQDVSERPDGDICDACREFWEIERTRYPGSGHAGGSGD